MYWGVGNPGPDWNGDVHLVDNLFADSVVALDADRGKRAWHSQFTPHDVHDHAAAQVMVLLNREYRDEEHKLLVTGNRNDFILHAGPRDRRVSEGNPVREANLGGRHLRSRAPDPAPGHGPDWSRRAAA